MVVEEGIEKLEWGRVEKIGWWKRTTWDGFFVFS
jgi:hypothetical protein